MQRHTSCFGGYHERNIKEQKDVTVIGKLTTIDWDGWNDQPTYLLENVHVFNKNGNLMDKIDHMWFLTDQELYELDKAAVIKFVGDSYKYNKCGHFVDYSIKPTSSILVMKWYDSMIKVGKWFMKKASKKMKHNK